jgi:hypothetical protein
MYTNEWITPESQYKLKKFIDNDKLNKLKLDKALLHIPKLQGSCIDWKPGQLTSSGKKAREKMCHDDFQMRSWWRRLGNVLQDGLFVAP